MARCCGGGCECKVSAGTRISVTGIGSANDPFVIAADVTLLVQDTDVINMSRGGSGTGLDPWIISATFADTAQLGDIPDVNVVGVTNAQVLGWNSSLNKWTPRAPTTAASGSVQHDTSLSGDGSGGSPLQVVEATGGGLTTSAGGLGLDDTTKRTLVRKFASDAARVAASPTPTVNDLSNVTSRPGQVDYWTGSQWLPVKSQYSVDGAGQQLLALSGAYVDGASVTMMVRHFSGVTAADGTLTVLPNSLLTGRAGVLSVTVNVTGAQSYMPVMGTGSNYIYITARRLDNGAVLASQNISGQVTAYVY
jgi:hypothetical protein